MSISRHLQVPVWMLFRKNIQRHTVRNTKMKGSKQLFEAIGMNLPSSCFSHEHLHIAWLTWRAENTYTLIMGTAHSMSIVPPQLQVNGVLTGCQPSVRHLHKCYSYEIQIHRWSSTQQGQGNRNEEQWLREEIPGNSWDVVGLTGGFREGKWNLVFFKALLK